MLLLLPPEILTYIGIQINDCLPLLNFMNTHPYIKESIKEHLTFIIRQIERNNTHRFKEYSMILASCYINQQASFSNFLDICNFMKLHTNAQIKSMISLLATERNITEEKIQRYISMRVNEHMSNNYALFLANSTLTQLSHILKYIKLGYPCGDAYMIAKMAETDEVKFAHMERMVKMGIKIENALYIVRHVDESHMPVFYFLQDKMTTIKPIHISRASMLPPNYYERMEQLVKKGHTYKGVKYNFTYDIAAFVAFTNLNERQIGVVCKIMSVDIDLVLKMINDIYIYMYRPNNTFNYDDDDDDEDEEDITSGRMEHKINHEGALRPPFPTQSESNLHRAFIGVYNALVENIDGNIAFKFYSFFLDKEKLDIFKQLKSEGYDDMYACRAINISYDDPDFLTKLNYYIQNGIDHKIAVMFVENGHQNLVELDKLKNIAKLISHIDFKTISEDNMRLVFNHLNMIAYSSNPICSDRIKIICENETLLAKYKKYMLHTNILVLSVYILDEKKLAYITMMDENGLHPSNIFRILEYIQNPTTRQIENVIILIKKGISFNIACNFILQRRDHHYNIVWNETHIHEIIRFMYGGFTPFIAASIVAYIETIQNKKHYYTFMSCIDAFKQNNISKNMDLNDFKLFLYIMENTDSFEKAFSVYSNMSSDIKNRIKHYLNMGTSFMRIFAKLNITIS